MEKTLDSWSSIKKYLEQDMIAEPLKDRVKYECTTFEGMDGCGIYKIIVDGKVIKEFSMENVADSVNVGEKPKDLAKYWKTYWHVKEFKSLEDRNEFDDAEFSEAFRLYQQRDIISALKSKNPIVRMFAVLDKRVGRRLLERLSKSVNEQPNWLRFFYILRLDSEKETTCDIVLS